MKRWEKGVLMMAVGLSALAFSACSSAEAGRGSTQSGGVSDMSEEQGLETDSAENTIPADTDLEIEEPVDIGLPNIYNELDISEEDGPPVVQLLTTKGDITTCTFATRVTYSWTKEVTDGVGESTEACGSPNWDEVAAIALEQTDGRIELMMDKSMTEYGICYWTLNATCGVADPVPMEGDTILLQDEYAKGNYELHVKYPQGDAYYYFKVI